MTKYGHYLAALERDCPDHFRAQFLRYKLLKKVLKDCIPESMPQAAAAVTATTTEAVAAEEEAAMGGEVAEATQQGAGGAAEQAASSASTSTQAAAVPSANTSGAAAAAAVVGDGPDAATSAAATAEDSSTAAATVAPPAASAPGAAAPDSGGGGDGGLGAALGLGPLTPGEARFFQLLLDEVERADRWVGGRAAVGGLHVAQCGAMRCCGGLVQGGARWSAASAGCSGASCAARVHPPPWHAV